MLKPTQVLPGLFRWMLCSAAGNAIPPCMASRAGGAAAGWSAFGTGRSAVTVAAQVVLVLLHDAVGSVLKCLAPRRSLRPLEEKLAVVSPCVMALSSQLCSSKVGFEKEA